MSLRWPALLLAVSLAGCAASPPVPFRMLERHPNLYYELSARTWPVHPRSPDYTILRDGVNAWPQWLELIEAAAGRARALRRRLDRS